MTAKEMNIVVHEHGSFTMSLDPEFYADWALLQAVSRAQWPEPEVSHLMVRVLRKGDTVIDGGANIGFYTCLMALLVGPEGSVLAFEPGTNNLDKLNGNIALNKFTNVHVDKRALWSEERKMAFFLNADSGQDALWPFPYSQSIEIETVTCDKVINGAPVKLAKIDVEGSEEHVLYGMSDMLDHGNPLFIACEINLNALAMMSSSVEAMRSFMEVKGYDTFAMDDGGDIPKLIPPKSRLRPRKFNSNILFSRIETVGEYWPDVMVGPQYETMSDHLK